jgi:L-methionine (R)-S-oxide reductase
MVKNADETALIAWLTASVAGPDAWNTALERVLEHFRAESGTIHFLNADGLLALTAACHIPPAVLDLIRLVPVGKGMAGLAVQRGQPVAACDLQTDTSGDVRPGARGTGLQGSIVVPMLRQETAVGALGIANRAERIFTSAEIDLLLRLGQALAEQHT